MSPFVRLPLLLLLAGCHAVPTPLGLTRLFTAHSRVGVPTPVEGERGARRVAGRVRDLHGQPVPGVKISVRVTQHRAHPATESESTPFDLDSPEGVQHLAWVRSYLRNSTRQAFSDAEGAFEIGAVPTLQYRWSSPNERSHRVEIFAELDGYFVYELEPSLWCADSTIDLTRTQRRTLPEWLDLVAVESREVELSVTDDSGEAPRWARVEVVRADAPPVQRISRTRFESKAVTFQPPIVPWETLEEFVWSPQHTHLRVPRADVYIVVHADRGSGFQLLNGSSRASEVSVTLDSTSRITVSPISPRSGQWSWPKAVELAWVRDRVREVVRAGEGNASSGFPWRHALHPSRLRLGGEEFVESMRHLFDEADPVMHSAPTPGRAQQAQIPEYVPPPILVVRPSDEGVNGRWTPRLYVLPKTIDDWEDEPRRSSPYPASNDGELLTTRTPAYFDQLPPGDYWVLGGFDRRCITYPLGVVAVGNDPVVVEVSPAMIPRRCELWVDIEFLGDSEFSTALASLSAVEDPWQESSGVTVGLVQRDPTGAYYSNNNCELRTVAASRNAMRILLTAQDLNQIEEGDRGLRFWRVGWKSQDLPLPPEIVTSGERLKVAIELE